MGKSNWTAADWREKRASDKANRPDFDKDDPFYHPRFVAIGREIARLEIINSMTPCPPKCDCVDCRRPKRGFIADDMVAISERMREIQDERIVAEQSDATPDKPIDEEAEADL